MHVPKYEDGQVMQVGDVWHCQFPGEEVRLQDQYTIMSITYTSESALIHWRHSSGVESYSPVSNSCWTLLKRSGPVIRKKTGFGKFVNRIEGSSSADASG